MRRLIYFFLLLAAAFSHARTWTDVQGRTMDAEAISFEGDGLVNFRKTDGMVYSFPLASLCAEDQAYLQEQLASGQLKAAPMEPTGFTSWLDMNLLSLQDGTLQRLRDADMSQVKYIAVYQSAHWCPPCRQFTPKLVKFYNRQKPKHPNFEIVFVSSDRDEEAMQKYMEEMEMPWPAIEYDRRKSGQVDKSSGNGIPCLMIFDREGNVIMDSYTDGGEKYIGPTAVMRRLGELIAE
ncbi:MAG: thioredoxin-like domain-containing protein [Puniceicoccales bacterium]